MQKGGKAKIIGEGTYGCVLKPHVKCDDDNSKSENNTSLIGKIFTSKKDYEIEKSIASKMHSFDKKKDLGFEKTCEVSKINDIISKCRILKKKNYHLPLYQIIYKYKGKSLCSRSISELTLKKVLVGLENLLETLQSIHNAKYQHLDIKPANIVFDGKKLHLIDFGLTTENHKIYRSDKNYIHQHKYIYYPPEFKVFVARNRKSCIDVMNENYSVYMTDLDNLKVNEDLSFINRAFAERKTNNKSTVFLPEKIDVFSLGICLLELYKASPAYKRIYVRNCRSKRLYTKLTEMIIQMTQFDPMKRVEISDVIRLYKELPL